MSALLGPQNTSGAPARLRHVSVEIRIIATTGYEGESTYAQEGNAAAISAVDELARILAIDGAGAQAIETVQSAVKRVDEWKRTQTIQASSDAA